MDKVIWQKDSRNLISNSNDAAWKKVLKDNNTFSMFPNGTLKIAPISSELDKGMYTCVVSNRKGELASGSVNINVMRKQSCYEKLHYKVLFMQVICCLVYLIRPPSDIQFKI